MNRFALTLAFLVTLVWNARVATSAEEDLSVDHLAVGKPVTFNAWPRRPTDGPVPDFGAMLTDGKYGRLPPWAPDSGWVRFFKTADIEMVVDLGEVHPIVKISSRHHSDTYRVFQPRRERYYVSEDGKTFFLVGECQNTWDPKPPVTETDRDRFFRGVKTFSSGPIKAKGRFVMVRTFPPFLQGKGQLETSVNFTYVGHDEIVVERGDFPLDDVVTDQSKPYVPEPPDLPADILGYRCLAVRWEDLFREGPLFLGPTPYAYVGEDEFHLSVGGTYVLAFEPMKNTNDHVTDVRFQCHLPAEVEVIATTDSMELIEKETATRDGRRITTYQYDVEAAVVQPTQYRERYGIPTLVLEPKTDRAGALGDLTFGYQYTGGGKRYDSGEQRLRLFLDEALDTTPPKEFRQGIWLMRLSSRFTDYEQTVRRLLTFYKRIGFNSAWGSGRAESYAIMKDLDLIRYGNTGRWFCPNGYSFAGNDRKIQNALADDDLFQFHPRFERWKQHGLCPELLASDAFYPRVKEKAKELLAASDHLYANWEPYMFQKRGCVCDRCRQAFQQFSRLTPEAVDKVWPDCVADINDEDHNRFASHQLALVHRQLQRAVSEASRELGRSIDAEFVPAVSDGEFDPDDRRYLTNGSREYCQWLGGASIWGMPFDVNIGVVNLPRAIGNNLAMLRDLENTLAGVEEYGRSENGRRRPRVYNVSGIHFGEGRFAMPRDHYFTALLNFAQGFDGHGSYREFGVDARYLRLRAKAAGTMGMYEHLTLHGKRADNVRADLVSPVPVVPGRQILCTKSYILGDEQLITLGNDYLYSFYVRLSVKEIDGDAPVYLLDRINGKLFGGPNGYSVGELARGVLIDVPHKEFRFLEVLRSLDGVDINRLTAVDESAMRAAFEQEEPLLAERAGFINALCE